MIVNVAEAKAKFSSLLSAARNEEEEIVISKRDKPVAVLLSYETFQKMKKALERRPNIEDLDKLPSSLDRYAGIVSENEIDYGYKKSREAYLKEKYL